MTNSQPTWTGRTIGGRYRIDALLGRGGMSSVYRATDPNLQRTVAIKLIHPHLSENPEFVKRFEQEAAAVAKLRHPNIMLVHDFNHDGKIYYIVFEYIAGEPLDKRLKALKDAGLRLPLDEVVRIMVPLCEAVAYAHERNMVHRDLKPSNIVINLLGQPILLDFGIAKIVGGDVHTATGATIGTAAYMAPEQVSGDGVDHRADIYSLGIMLYEMACGRPPYEGKSVLTVMMKHVTDPVPDIRLYNANVPAPFVTILEQALAKEPARRFDSAVEMAAALREVGRQLAVSSDTYSYTGTVVEPETLAEELPPRETPPESAAAPTPKPKAAVRAEKTASEPKSIEPAPPKPAPARVRVSQPAPQPASPTPSRPASQPTASGGRRRLVPLLVGVGVLALLVVAALLLLPRLRGGLPSVAGMTQIPAGTYTVGSASNGGQYAPQQQVTLDSYWIDRFEVTNAQYAEYLADSNASPPAGWDGTTPPAGKSAHPVIGVPWETAEAYCQWRDKRLPTEAEWEVAARGADSFAYPWGDEATAVSLPDTDTYAVGSIAANRSSFGVFDMTGNVWEWVDNPYADTPSGERVARGGSFNFLRDLPYRLVGDPSLPSMYSSVGVRCAASEVAEEPDPDLVLVDDFTDQTSGWPDVKEENAWRGYHPPDFYHVEATGSNQVATAVFEQDVDNVSIETNVFVDIVESEAGDFRYGLMLRHVSEKEFYAFAVSLRQGNWFVLKGTNDGLQTLAEGGIDTLTGWSADEADTLSAVVNGNTFTFFVNGRFITTVVDDAYAEGDLGFFVETFDETRAHVHFDTLVARQLDGAPLAVANVTTPSTVDGAETAVATETAAATEIAAEVTTAPVATSDEVEATAEPTDTPAPTAVVPPLNMVLIPTGTFLMGSTTGEANEQPEHEVTLDAFFIDQFEVTNEDYRVCVAEGGCTQAGLANSFRRVGYRNDPVYANYPVIGVSWNQANAYCEWADKRLPTEAEWEYAASGPDNFTWPWGNEFDPALSAASSEDTEPVDAFPDGVSPFGVFNMAGNVNEWVLDRFDANFYANSPAENPVNAEGGTANIYRGGSFDNTNGAFFTTSRRYTANPGNFDVDIGFRCAQNVP